MNDLNLLGLKVKKKFVYDEIIKKIIDLPKKLEKRKRIKKRNRIFHNTHDEIIKNLILNSNVDFNKRFWVREISKIIKYTNSATKRWMKKNMREFYEENCYKSTVEKNKQKNGPIAQLAEAIDLKSI